MAPGAKNRTETAGLFPGGLCIRRTPGLRGEEQEGEKKDPSISLAGIAPYCVSSNSGVVCAREKGCAKGRMISLICINAMRYHSSVIRSFRDRQTQNIFEGRYSDIIPQNLTRPTERKLRILHRASSLEDLRIPPGNRLEPLKGSRKGQWSIRINDQYRICFLWKDADAYEVEIVDYH